MLPYSELLLVEAARARGRLNSKYYVEKKHFVRRKPGVLYSAFGAPSTRRGWSCEDRFGAGFGPGGLAGPCIISPAVILLGGTTGRAHRKII